jgi:hypothetical protein
LNNRDLLIVLVTSNKIITLKNTYGIAAVNTLSTAIIESENRIVNSLLYYCNKVKVVSIITDAKLQTENSVKSPTWFLRVRQVKLQLFLDIIF